MQQRRYASGDVVFREGEPSDSVCKIVEGRVEVVKEEGTHRVVLGHIGKGDYVGEMGVIEGRPRSATVCAENEVTVEWIERGAFLKQISEDSKTALEVIIRLSQRLSSLNQVYSGTVFSSLPASDVGQHSASEARELSKLIIFGDSRDFGDVLPREGLVIDTYPFVVGRRLRGGESAPMTGVDLKLRDSKPYRMSRAHFAIHRTTDGFRVQDLESTLGTSLNGTFLGTHFGDDLGPLKRGENFIIAGGVGSKFAFTVMW